MRMAAPADHGCSPVLRVRHAMEESLPPSRARVSTPQMPCADRTALTRRRMGCDVPDDDETAPHELVDKEGVEKVAFGPQSPLAPLRVPVLHMCT